MLDASTSYKILGLKNNASFKEIKQAYRTLSLRYHPDKTKNYANSQKFKEIIEAYQFLRLEQKKLQKNPKDVESAHAKFWRYYDKRMEQEFQFHQQNFSSFARGTRNKIKAESNQEKPISQRMTHLILYVGLGVMTLWIVLYEILK